ncbi:glutamine--fructose-6-phosphate aminotransferase [Candidatus Desantisbacteria bacterium CG2_30_40_21]|uniref:Glutamine--fructose-6-phosphate aminotransferase [isomerizing] n=2 Tax=unclassified Candidatus Desantisiibacteriota TaxID=3106372 RepID=A0A2M7P2U0_9BACT|nr:MAG: glutamine--fructose-6-phosphate aminotransferase [Candidatus Desantisbacteria bacterium CG2_30_40_21]PIY19961.1 MAG: glutamine--fructose-6-phosphate transaminase (isomerizing) [Candidatus Desantisbacteria bacterium CG_4_10_14_3_um_filter_40_18]
MCGIVGYVGYQDVSTVLLDGLKRLEYRGYDSAGIAVLNNNIIEVRRSKGKLNNLEEMVKVQPVPGNIGLGHTRWATHGRPSEENAHPHRDCKNEIIVVHNGIVENYLSLKDELQLRGHVFASETDTEVFAHLIEEELDRQKTEKESLYEAVRLALKRVRGTYALGVLSTKFPGQIIAARNDSPLIVGLGENEYFIASDVPAILNHTRDVIFLDNGEMAVLNQEGVKITTLEAVEKEKAVVKITWSATQAEKADYKHFMLKEIFEQPTAIEDTMRTRLGEDNIHLEEMELSLDQLKTIEKVTIIACGTSWHAGLVGKFIIEELVRIPVEVDIASEFRYRSPIISDKTLTIAISQSGETADTLAGIRQAKANGSKVISICNVLGSSIPRESDGTIYTHAGPEIGVASTKAFTSQLTALYLFTIYLGRARDTIGVERAKDLISELRRLPHLVGEILKKEDANLKKLAHGFSHYKDFLYLGRGINYPIALEGALKLKEISYIHAEGYPAGEMKHGPIALIDEDMPVVTIAVRSKTYEKILGNIEEVKARDGIVITLATEGDAEVTKKADHIIYLPDTMEIFSSLLTIIPLQLLAYYIADRKGCDVDQPRNLAKSVTVE